MSATRTVNWLPKTSARAAILANPALRLLSLILAGVVANAVGASGWSCDDSHGVLGQTEAPVTVVARLSAAELAAAREGRLGLVVEPANERSAPTVLPVQWLPSGVSGEPAGVLLLPPGASGPRKVNWRQTEFSFPSGMRATRDLASGQIDITDNGHPVLRYNYRTVEPGAVLEKVAAGNRIYARARSDYIHPLYGLNGETLTRDWSVDHPHHRGIYWAWPEVDYGTARGDLHALQKVFARPTGNVRLASGPVFAQIQAENQWLWEDREPIVRELALIRAYRATPAGRIVDLAFQFTALKPGVSLARRETDKYGGLNVRMETPRDQHIATFTDSVSARPRRAWSDLSGQFAGGPSASGLTVLQHARNPDYPGDWIQYPELSWCQPTFPASGTRYALKPGKPLVLRFRLWVHAGAKPDDTFAVKLWDAFHAAHTALLTFETAEIKSPQ